MMEREALERNDHYFTPVLEIKSDYLFTFFKGQFQGTASL